MSCQGCIRTLACVSVSRMPGIHAQLFVHLDLNCSCGSGSCSGRLLANLSSCKYDILREVTRQMGYDEADETVCPWCLWCWWWGHKDTERGDVSGEKADTG